MSRARHVPVRMCIVCGAVRPKGSLIRLVTIEGRGVVVDEEKVLGGRGMYVCAQQQCIERLIKGEIRRRKGARLALAEEAIGALGKWQEVKDGQAGV